jgi:hypothetical protein
MTERRDRREHGRLLDRRAGRVGHDRAADRRADRGALGQLRAEGWVRRRAPLKSGATLAKLCEALGAPRAEPSGEMNVPVVTHETRAKAIAIRGVKAQKGGA